MCIPGISSDFEHLASPKDPNKHYICGPHMAHIFYMMWPICGKTIWPISKCATKSRRMPDDLLNKTKILVGIWTPDPWHFTILYNVYLQSLIVRRSTNCAIEYLMPYKGSQIIITQNLPETLWNTVILTWFIRHKTLWKLKHDIKYEDSIIYVGAC